jgi:hypothetical protein
MKKIELIWREVLDRGLTSPVFEQKRLATNFGLSTSTVHAAVMSLKNIGGVRITGRNFKIINFEKILLFWATHRNLVKDIIYQTHVDLPVLEIEGLVDNKTIFGAYTAARYLLGEAPAEYDKVYVYGTENLFKRFPKQKGQANFFVLKPDPFLKSPTTSVAQTFVDIWNLSDWFAKDFLDVLKSKFYAGIL